MLSLNTGEGLNLSGFDEFHERPYPLGGVDMKWTWVGQGVKGTREEGWKGELFGM